MTSLVYQRKGSAFWYFDITVDGVRRRRSTKRTKKAEAELVAAKELRDALDRTQLGREPELTLREALFDVYLPTRINCASYKNLTLYARAVCGDRKGIKGIGGDTKFHQISYVDLVKYRAGRLANGVSEQTVDHEIKVVSAAYNLVKKDYRVRQGMAFPMTRPKGKARPLLPEEVEALLKDLDPARKLGTEKGEGYFIPPIARVYAMRVDNYDLVVMLLDTGARFGEIAKLTWDRVSPDFTSIWLHRGKVDNLSVLMTTDRMREVLRRRREARGNSAFVFPGWADASHNKHATDDGPRSTTIAIRRAMANVGINAPEKVAIFGRRSVRSLRDTFATELRRKGLALDDLQLLLGHSSPAMTAKYTHYDAEAASNKAIALLNQR